MQVISKAHLINIVAQNARTIYPCPRDFDCEGVLIYIGDQLKVDLGAAPTDLLINGVPHSQRVRQLHGATGAVGSTGALPSVQLSVIPSGIFTYDYIRNVLKSYPQGYWTSVSFEIEYRAGQRYRAIPGSMLKLTTTNEICIDGWILPEPLTGPILYVPRAPATVSAKCSLCGLALCESACTELRAALTERMANEGRKVADATEGEISECRRWLARRAAP